VVPAGSYRQPAVSVGAKTSALLAAGALALSGCSLGEQGSRPPRVGAKATDQNATSELGFPALATRNTVRVGGADVVSDAAGVANALFPAMDRSTRPAAVALVDKGDWQDAVTGSVLASAPVGAPILLTDGGSLPSVTKATLGRLAPRGLDIAKGVQVIRVGGGVAKPGGLRTGVIEGKDQYARAAAIDRFFSAAKGKPSADVVVASGEKAPYAMPAAAWAARSGDAVLLTKRSSVPAATRQAIAQHSHPNIYVLGPPSVVSAGALRQLSSLGNVVRVADSDPVRNAVAFTRFHRGAFGWGITAPGYNFSVANTSRPLDVAGAASLATKGVFAPLLLTDKAGTLPKALEDFFLSVQPGYQGQPNQAVYNHLWILGDDKALSVGAQARLDQLTELVPVQAGGP
jgi:hypothetical protein